jgi:hypothetical protein
MAVPKKKKTDFVLNPPQVGHEYMKYGMERIEQLMIKSDTKTTYLPKAIAIEDINAAAFDFIKNGEMKIVIDGKDVPTVYMTNERWGEFSKTWQYVDGDKNLVTPFVTVTDSDIQEGTRLGIKWNIPQRRVFRYMDVPIMDEGEEINLRFKIAQPVSVDITFDVRLFSKYKVDIDRYNEQTLKVFGARQAYIWVKGHPFPVILESLSKEDTVQDIKGDKMYVTVRQIKVLGYLQFAEDFQIVKTTRKPKIGVDVTTRHKKKSIVVGQDFQSYSFEETFDESFE